MIEIENKETLEEFFKTGVNLFLGSAFSILANGKIDNESKPLPTGGQLLNEIKIKFNKKNSKLELPQLCQVISSTKKEELIDFFKKRFDVISFDERYKQIQHLNIKSIFTTNVDNLIHKIYEGSDKNYISDISIRGATIKNNSSIDYIALHGSITHDPNESLDFTPLEISSSFERDKDKWYQYRRKISEYPTVYWGYSLSDYSVLQAISKDSNSVLNKNSWIVVRDGGDEDSKEYFKSLGFNIIVADTSLMLDYIIEFNSKKKSDDNENVKIGGLERFREYLLPKQGTTVVRKRDEFYYGEEPIWFDIYSGHIHRTEYFFKIKNNIFSKINVIITGGMITGKTTLLKQLANEFNSIRNCLYIKEIIPEKAKMIKEYCIHNNIELIAFIDNAADSWESVNILLECKSIRVVIAERDYIYDSISHRFQSNTFEVLDVSEINDKDRQSIEESIPFQVNKKKYTNKNKLKIKKTEPTIYDILKMNGIHNIITERFMNAVDELKIESKIKYQLLLLACYSYYCRIPVSLDMAISFVSNYNYQDVLNSINSMNSLISDYNGDLGDDLQMYFTPKSRIAAEEIISKVQYGELSSILETFHENVSKINIPRYDIFKRFAFDANITYRAYPLFEDGQQFYKRFLYRDDSHSYCQQAALYCLRKHRYTEAFEWIDKALTIAKGYAKQTIRNTYAVILFSANYDLLLKRKIETIEIKSSLDESMDILINCYNTDLKKTYHAKVFAEQAIKYYNVINDTSKLKKYIEISINWVQSELIKIPNKRNFKTILYKLRIIDSKLK
ncbi:SIR2 family protein [Providencia stuartii]|uniref:P-loop NTPase n=1 Tax=Providencia stuartii TaxID=588 RepID=UPI0032DB9DB9